MSICIQCIYCTNRSLSTIVLSSMLSFSPMAPAKTMVLADPMSPQIGVA